MRALVADLVVAFSTAWALPGLSATQALARSAVQSMSLRSRIGTITMEGDGLSELHIEPVLVGALALFYGHAKQNRP